MIRNEPSSQGAPNGRECVELPRGLSSQGDMERSSSNKEVAEQPRERRVARGTPSGQEGIEWAARGMLSV